MANFIEMTDGTSDALAVPGEPGYDELVAAGFVHTADYVAPKVETPKAKAEESKAPKAKAEEPKTEDPKSSL